MRVHTTRTRRARIALGVPAVVLLAATALAGCGSDDEPTTTTPTTSGSSGASTAPSSDASAVLGPEKKATGEPVKIGYAFEGTSAAIDTSGQLKAAEAVVKYANERLGGIGGRPIQIVSCETKGSPATAQDCGNQFVSEKVAAVSAGSLGQTDPVLKAINAAGIPLVDILNSSQTVLGSPMNFSLSNPLNPFGGAAIFAKENGIKQVALIVIDVPGAIGPAKQLAPLFFGNAGAQVEVIGIAPGAADATPQIQAAQAKKPGQYHVIGNPAFCGSVVKAIKTLGIDAKITGIDRCLDKTSAASIPGGYEGFVALTPANLDPANDETKLYDAIRETYGSGLETSPDVTVGYQAMLGLIRAVDAGGALTDFTPAGLLAAIKSMPAAPLPLAGGATFQCNGKQVSIAPGVCSTGGITATSDKDGVLSGFKTVEDPSIYVFPSK
jgi:ABC-type branched-subunit amino acid transport system substrate-binding protein